MQIQVEPLTFVQIQSGAPHFLTWEFFFAPPPHFGTSRDTRVQSELDLGLEKKYPVQIQVKPLTFRDLNFFFSLIQIEKPPQNNWTKPPSEFEPLDMGISRGLWYGEPLELGLLPNEPLELGLLQK